MGSGNTKPFPLVAASLSPTSGVLGYTTYHFGFPDGGTSTPQGDKRPHQHQHQHHHLHDHRQSPSDDAEAAIDPASPPRSSLGAHPPSSPLLDSFPTPPPKLLRVFSPSSPTRCSSPPALLPPPLYNSPPPQPRARALSSPLGGSPRSIASEHSMSHHSLAEISCVSSLVSEPEEIEVIGEEEDEDDDDEEGEAEEERMRSGEEEQHVESLRKFRTQQAIRNLLLEREVKILQAQLEELELMEKEEQAAAQVQGKGDCGSLGGGLASYYYDPSSSLAELNRLYNNVLRCGPVPLPFSLPTGGGSQACGGSAQPPGAAPLSPCHSASDKSCHTEPGIGRVREAKVRRLKQKHSKRRSSQQPQPRGSSVRAGGSMSSVLSTDRTTAIGRLHKGLPTRQHQQTGHRRSQSDAKGPASGDEKDDKAAAGKWAFQQSNGAYRLAAKRQRGSHIVFLDESGGGSTGGCRFPRKAGGGAPTPEKPAPVERGRGGGGDGATTARSVGSSSECEIMTDFLQKAGITLLGTSGGASTGKGKKGRGGAAQVDSGEGAGPPAGASLVTVKGRSSPPCHTKESDTPRSLGNNSLRQPPRKKPPPAARTSPIPPLAPDMRGRGGKNEAGKAAEEGGQDKNGSGKNQAAGGGESAAQTMATQWAEVELLLCKPVRSSADIHKTVLQTDAGLAFMDQLDRHARQLNVLRGTLARWLLPFDTNTAASEQRSVVESVLENEPDDLRGKLSQEEIQFLVRGANNVRKLIRVKIADDADLDQARRALRTAQSFFEALMNDAELEQIEPYDLLCRNTQSLETETSTCGNSRASPLQAEWGTGGGASGSNGPIAAAANKW